jgi:hypothetical protein
VFRKIVSTDDTITGFAPALRTEAQGKAFRLVLQVLGDLVGLGVNYFDTDNVGYVKTAAEVSSDNSALMRNIRKNENALQGVLVDVSRAVMACSRFMVSHCPRRATWASYTTDPSSRTRPPRSSRTWRRSRPGS